MYDEECCTNLVEEKPERGFTAFKRPTYDEHIYSRFYFTLSLTEGFFSSNIDSSPGSKSEKY
jgi:hypothetical protein